MWTKPFRKSLISGVYENIFRTSLEGIATDIDWHMIAEEYSNDEQSVNVDDLSKVYEHIQSEHDKYVLSIKKYSKHWDRTYDIIKACLIVFLGELEYTKKTTGSYEQNLVGKYIRLAQDFAGGENPALVHAIASKLLNEYK